MMRNYNFRLSLQSKMETQGQVLFVLNKYCAARNNICLNLTNNAKCLLYSGLCMLITWYSHVCPCLSIYLPVPSPIHRNWWMKIIYKCETTLTTSAWDFYRLAFYTVCVPLWTKTYGYHLIYKVRYKYYTCCTKRTDRLSSVGKGEYVKEVIWTCK